MNTGSTRPDYATAFAERRTFCRRLLNLSREQQRLIDEGDYDRLIRVLNEKQSVLDSLTSIHRELFSPVDRWRADREQLPPAERTQCETLLKECELLLAELIGQEQTATRSLTERRDQTRDELQQLGSGARIHSNYRAAAAPAAGQRLDVRQ